MKINNRMEILFWRHSTSAQKKSNTSTIYLRITVAGSREDIGSTGIRIDTGNWCEHSQRVSKQDPLSNFKNEQIAIIETRLWAIYNDLVRKNQGITAERIKRMFVRSEDITYLAAWEIFQKEYNAAKDIEQSTKDKLKTIKQSILRYLKASELTDILLDEFDANVIDGYKAWSRHQGHKDSYILRNVRGIIRITAYAKTKKMIDFDPLDDYKVGREKILNPKFINSVQLAIWQNHSFVSETSQMAADVFVLYARTGFHYRDLAQVMRRPDEFITTGIDGKQWIIKPRQKTEVDAKLPIHQFPEIQKIIEKYGGWTKVPRFTNDKLNQWLKVCAAEMNMHLLPEQRIYGKLSVKHGRNSFCDYCFNELGLAKEAILTMLGRLTDSELKRYVRTDERGVVTAFELRGAAMAS